VLNDFGVIYVTPRDRVTTRTCSAGANPCPAGRYNIMQQYPVDPQRVYVAGFSGGSRVALRLVLGYPTCFAAQF